MPTVNHSAFKSYADFWPFYLSQHSKPATRYLHIAGTATAILVLAAAIIRFDPALLGAAVLTGYGFAWIAHAVIEKNRPATFTHPLWSLRGDLHMLWLWVTRRLEAEVFRQKAL